MSDSPEETTPDTEDEPKEDPAETEEDADEDDDDCYGFDDDSFFEFKDSDGEMKDPVPVPDNENRPKLFEFLDEAPCDHTYYGNVFTPDDSKVFACAMVSERTMMEKDLPVGIHVKFFENRLDLCTAMIKGPKDTPYEDCLFFFDVQMSKNYPKSAPKVKFRSYTSLKLNPNLYQNGLVCLSLLGTWQGDSVETWSSTKSSLLQLFVSIQGLILVNEPYYNEPGFFQMNGKRTKDSEMYNSKVLDLVLETILYQIDGAPSCFHHEMREHYTTKGNEICNRIESYIKNPEIAPFPLDSHHDYTSQTLEKCKKAIAKLSEEKPPPNEATT